MNKTLASLLAMAGLAGASATASNDLATYARFRARQREQPRTQGSNRRSNALLGLVQGDIQRGTRAKNRGLYPAHMIANCEKMRARNAKRIAGKSLAYSSLELTVNGEMFIEWTSINYGDDS